MTYRDVLAKVDPTVLKQTTTSADIQKLCDGSVWKFYFKIKYIVAEADQHCGNKRINSDDSTHFLA